jgi:hypothetical protein
MRDGLGLIAAFLEHLADMREPLRDVAGDDGGVSGRIETVRIEPDRAEAIADLGVAQIAEIDAEPGAIGKLAVIFSLAGKVGEDLDRMADIDDQDEGRPAMVGGKRARILFGLLAGVAHQYVPAPLRAAAAARLWRDEARQDGLLGKCDLLGAAEFAALLCFEHEAAALVEIDPPMAGFPGLVVERHGTLEDVIIPMSGRRGGFRLGKVEQAAQLGQEEGKIRPLGAAFVRYPARDEPFKCFVFPHDTWSRVSAVRSATKSLNNRTIT